MILMGVDLCPVGRELGSGLCANGARWAVCDGLSAPACPALTAAQSGVQAMPLL